YIFGGQSFYVAPNDFEISATNQLYMGTISVPGTNCGGGRLYPSKDEVLWNLQNTISGSDRIEIAAYSTNQNLFYIAA
ncbi:MAG: hypothetical protein QMB11_00910, partial [Nonlabens sp.]|uniref:hypothetical protein n=1 Tax=Nonlabens sp. TaxID=1888209 RepID=UPI0035A57574